MKERDMPISREELLKELLPGLNALFGVEYQKYGSPLWFLMLDPEWDEADE